jgi:hypothetical protein
MKTNSSSIMVEFTILFKYNDRDQKAGVVKSESGDGTEYDVRPIDPTIVQKFGKQIIIYKENENFNTNNHIDEDYIGFFNALVDALKQQDSEGFQ